jgi:hypothetical protein
MTSRARRTTTLVGPNRLALAAATGGLVALASAGTALLVLTGTSAVGPTVAVAPPLPTTEPLAKVPGVVVVPSPASSVPGSRPHRAARSQHRVPTPAALPAALAFAIAPPAVDPAVAVRVPAVQPTAKDPVRSALRREPVVADPEAEKVHPGRHLAKGHRLHSNGHVAPAGKRHARSSGKHHTAHEHQQRGLDD